MTNSNQIQENNNELRECIEMASALPDKGVDMEAIKEFIFSLSNFEVSTREDFDSNSYSGNFTFNTKDTPTWLDFVNSEYNKDGCFYFYGGYVTLNSPNGFKAFIHSYPSFNYNSSYLLNPYDKIIPHYFYRIGNYAPGNYVSNPSIIRLGQGESWTYSVRSEGSPEVYILNPGIVQANCYSDDIYDHYINITPIKTGTCDVVIKYFDIDESYSVREIFQFVVTDMRSETITLDPTQTSVKLQIPENNAFSLNGIDDLTDVVTSVDYENNILTINYTTTEPIEVTVKYTIE